MPKLVRRRWQRSAVTKTPWNWIFLMISNQWFHALLSLLFHLASLHLDYRAQCILVALKMNWICFHFNVIDISHLSWFQFCTTASQASPQWNQGRMFDSCCVTGWTRDFPLEPSPRGSSIGLKKPKRKKRKKLRTNSSWPRWKAALRTPSLKLNHQTGNERKHSHFRPPAVRSRFANRFG